MCWPPLRRERGVDNAIVEIDSNEPPIADGSSGASMSALISEARVRSTRRERREVYAVTAPIEFEAGGSLMSVFPATACASPAPARTNRAGSPSTSAWMLMRRVMGEGDRPTPAPFCFFEGD